MNKSHANTLVNVQALRGLAAAMVVIVHLSVLGAALGLAKADTDLFAVGVDLFFIISGFVMVYTTTRRTVTPTGFFLNRITRIVPLYWFMTAAVCGLIILAPKLMVGTRFSVDHLVKSLLFIPYMREDSTIMPMLFVGWSLDLEMLFYVFFAIALNFAHPSRRVMFTVAWLVSIVALGKVFAGDLSPVGQFLTQPIMLEFALGMAIGLVFERLPESHRAGKIAVALMIPVFVAMLVVARHVTPGGWPVSALPAAALVVAVLVAERSGRKIDLPGVVLIGDASYALYLTHPFVTQAMVFMARRLHLLHFALVPMLALSSLIAAVAVGIGSHLLIEKQLVRAAGRLLSGTRPALVAPTDSSVLPIGDYRPDDTGRDGGITL